MSTSKRSFAAINPVAATISDSLRHEAEKVCDSMDALIEYLYYLHRLGSAERLHIELAVDQVRRALRRKGGDNE